MISSSSAIPVRPCGAYVGSSGTSAVAVGAEVWVTAAGVGLTVTAGVTPVGGSLLSEQPANSINERSVPKATNCQPRERMIIVTTSLQRRPHSDSTHLISIYH